MTRFSAPVDDRLVTLDVAADLYAVQPLTPQTSRPPELGWRRPRQTALHRRRAAGRVRITASQIAAAWAAARQVRAVLRRPGLAPLLALADPARRGDREPVAVVAAAEALNQLSPWLPFEGACLARSALMIAYLNRLGLQADWVFGVRLRPFEAHCWVQLDDVALNEDVERLAAFTPVMVR